MAIPTFDLTLCPPEEMDEPAIMGGGLEGGRALSGVTNAQNLTGGGLVTVAYRKIALGNVNPAGRRYWNRLAAILNSGARSVVVPLLTDFTIPGGFSAALNGAAAVNAGTIAITATGIRPTDAVLAGGEWFGIVGPNRGARAHVVTDVDAVQVNGDGTAAYTLGIAPPFREAYPAGTALGFVRPACLMRLAPGFQMKAAVQPGQWAAPDVEFIESFGST